ncbi:hypothetical protein CL629_02900 [bacterium]|nr:hypothetical protein [bacterium]
MSVDGGAFARLGEVRAVPSVRLLLVAQLSHLGQEFLNALLLQLPLLVGIVIKQQAELKRFVYEQAVKLHVQLL